MQIDQSEYSALMDDVIIPGKNDPQYQYVLAQFDELRPQLRVPLEATADDASLRTALAELQESMDRFNDRWRKLLDETDLTEVNRRRDEYNRWYVLEKECFVGSPRIARQGYRALEMVTRERLAGALPELLGIHQRPV